MLVAAWCCFIFWMSANTGAVSQGMSDGIIASVIKAVHPGFASMGADEQAAAIAVWSFPVRKAAHFSEYAMLAVLASNAAAQLGHLKAHEAAVLPWWLFAAAWVFCVLFATGDEFHQLFVDGRSGQPFDVFVDSCGALLGVLIARMCQRHVDQRPKAGAGTSIRS